MAVTVTSSEWVAPSSSVTVRRKTNVPATSPLTESVAVLALASVAAGPLTCVQA